MREGCRRDKFGKKTYSLFLDIFSFCYAYFSEDVK